jgi:enoyl-CoA hydratase/carnithine racemase
VTDDVLERSRRGHVEWLTLNRPDAMNALNRELKRAIIAAATEVSLDPDVWVVVIRGAGGKAFCVGADLKEMGEDDRAGRSRRPPMLEAERNLYETVLEIPKPTVAAVEGYALGGGFELALACDLRVASDDSVFAMPESKIGMGANFGSVLLPRLIPRAQALEILYFGERHQPAQLLKLGLLNAVWPKAELTARVEAWTDELATRAPLTLQRYKHMTLKGWELSLSANLRLDAGPNPYTSADRIEGTTAFREKRPPHWQAR